MNFILDQHASGASAAWLWRDSAVGEPHYSLRDLAELDGRLHANIDGLSLAGEAGWNLAVDELKWKDPGELFVVVVLAIEEGDSEKIQLAFQSVGDSVELRRALISALGWVAWDRCQPLADEFAEEPDGFWRYVGLAAYELHRVDPGVRLVDFLTDENVNVAARAARCVGTLARVDLLDHLAELTKYPNELIRFQASWALALRRCDAAAIRALDEVARANDELSEWAASLLMSVLPIHDASLLVNDLAQGKPRQVRLATILSGQLGIVEGIPWLIDMMKQPVYARVAGEAFSRITGLRLDQRPFEGDWPAGFEAGPNEDPEDENVEMDPDENLPFPTSQAVAEWWNEHQARFQANTRYLLGWELDDPAWLEKVLVLGRQRERAMAALELSVRQPNRPLFEIRANGNQQIQRLQAGRLPTEEYRCYAIEAGPE